MCQELLTLNTGNLSSDYYLNKLSRGGLTSSSTDLVHYVAKSFAILDCAKKFDKYEQERKEREEIVHNLMDVDDLAVEKQEQYSGATACYFMEFLKRNKKILTSCVSKR